jgi:Flp pilus assembly pilin Flp
MTTLGTMLTSFFRDRRGVTSVEYTLLLALIAGGTIASVIALNEAVSSKMHESVACIESDNPQTDCS